MSGVTIAGGGLIGLSIALECAQRGLRVTVFDPDPGTGASYAAAGMLAPGSEYLPGDGADNLLELCTRSLNLYPHFLECVEHVAERSVTYNSFGTTQVAVTKDDALVLEAWRSMYAELGLEPEQLEPEDALRYEPNLADNITSGTYLRTETSVDPRSLHRAVYHACIRSGVSIEGYAVTGVLREGERAAGVTLNNGDTVRSDVTVLAIGAGAGDLPGVGRELVPVFPVKGQILRMNGPRLLLGTVRAVAHGNNHIYLVPRPGGELVIGATQEANAEWDARVTGEGVSSLLNGAISVVPRVAELEFTEATARFRPGTRDGGPILGPSELPGLVLATGHHRNGVLLTPVTARLIADHLTGATPDPLLYAFTPDRLRAVHGC